jgi:hypothetical protein
MMGDDEMMGRTSRARPVRKATPNRDAVSAAQKAALATVAAAQKASSKGALAVKAKSAAATAKTAKVAAKKVSQSKAPANIKKEAMRLAADAAKIAERAAKLSAMAGIEPSLMGESGDFYNIGHDSLSLGAVEQFSGYGAEPVLMGDADFGEVQMYGEDEGMMGGLMDTLKSPIGMAAVAAAAFLVWKKMKK